MAPSRSRGCLPRWWASGQASGGRVGGWASGRVGKQSWGRAEEVLDLAAESLPDLLPEIQPHLLHDLIQKLPDMIPKLVEYLLHAVVVTQGCCPQRNDTFEVVCFSLAGQDKTGLQPHQRVQPHSSLVLTT